MSENVVVSVSRFLVKDEEDKKKKLNENLEKQSNSCHYCGIDIKKHHKLHYITKEESVAVCPICYYSQHIEELPEGKAGKIIFLNEMSQLDLIVLARIIEMIKRLPIKDYEEDVELAGTLSLMLYDLQEQTELFYSPGSSSVELMSQVLINQSDEDYDKREQGFFCLRWLPDFEFFKEELDDWYKDLMENESSKFHPKRFESLLQKMKQKGK